jgi:hypothetical protein
VAKLGARGSELFACQVIALSFCPALNLAIGVKCRVKRVIVIVSYLNSLNSFVPFLPTLRAACTHTNVKSLFRERIASVHCRLSLTWAGNFPKG